MRLFQVGEVIQFNENHKWCGCFGTIAEVKAYEDGSVRYMIEVPHITSEEGIVHVYPAYIFVSSEDRAIEYIGPAIFMTRSTDDENTGSEKTTG